MHGDLNQIPKKWGFKVATWNSEVAMSFDQYNHYIVFSSSGTHEAQVQILHDVEWDD
tara:strand:+ start:4059 stop:4229 length:171 start_codon:yes stop_codon:yes gene_type:complete